MTRKNLYPALIATLVVLSTALVGVFAVPSAVGTADARSVATSPHEPKANYTFSPDDHAPGVENTGAEHYAVGLEKDLTALHTVVVESEAFDFSDCSSTDTEAFGIDRGNDDPGTQTDEGLVTKYKSIDFRANKIVVEFYKEGGIGQSTVGIETNDQIVARGGGCYDNPDEEGWYQVTGTLNGSTNDDTNTDYGITVETHYIYVCDCDSRQEAVDKLGPPPSQEGSGGDGSTATPTPAPTATATPTESGGGGGSTATPTSAPTERSGGDDSTATATPTESSGGGSTATPTSGGGDGTATPTNDTSTNATAAPNGTDTGTNATNATASTDGSSDVGGEDSNVSGTTPTSSGDGPGFGLLAALGALVTGGLLTRRRDD